MSQPFRVMVGESRLEWDYVIGGGVGTLMNLLE